MNTLNNRLFPESFLSEIAGRHLSALFENLTSPEADFLLLLASSPKPAASPEALALVEPFYLSRPPLNGSVFPERSPDTFPLKFSESFFRFYSHGADQRWFRLSRAQELARLFSLAEDF